MKKFLCLLMAVLALFVVTGCEKVKQQYKEGTYIGSTIDPYNDEGNIASAIVEIDENGKIAKVMLDTTYKTSDGQETTKKVLGDDYNMKKYNPNAAGEWYEQVEKLEEAIVEHNGVDFITLKEDSTTDAVSGCTIKVDALVAAVEKALESSKYALEDEE